MFTRSVLITPGFAKELLDRGARNRPIREDRVNAYARDILAGNWKQTGETIKIGLSGKPLDGQHRLSAVVKANASVTMLVAYDVDDAVFDYIDTGTPRIASDLIALSGVANGHVVAAALRFMIMQERGAFDGTSKGGQKQASVRIVTNHEIVDALQRHPGIVASVTNFNRLAKEGKGGSGLLMGGGLASFLMYQFGRQDSEKAAAFFLGLAGRMTFEQTSPVHRLREKLIANRLSNSRLKPSAIAAITIKSWVLFRDNKQAKETLVFRKNEAFPTF